MKKHERLKGFLLGILVSLICATTILPAFAKAVDVLLNSVNIELNGENVATIGQSYTLSNGTEVPFSILYEGTTYLPLRKIGELYGKEIGWDGKTETASINDVVEPEPTPKPTPVPTPKPTQTPDENNSSVTAQEIDFAQKSVDALKEQYSKDISKGLNVTILSVRHYAGNSPGGVIEIEYTAYNYRNELMNYWARCILLENNSVKLSSYDKYTSVIDEFRFDYITIPISKLNL